MGADLIVAPTPVPYECLGFQQGGEGLFVDEFRRAIAPLKATTGSKFRLP